MDLHSVHQRLITVASEMGFVQSSEGDLGRFMRLLVASRPGGRFLELSTGVGFGGDMSMHQAPAPEASTQQRVEPAATVRRQRRPIIVVLAVLLVLLGAAGGAWLYLGARDTVEVVVARVAIPRGTVMEASQFVTVQMPPNEQLRYVAAADIADPFGQRAAHDVPAGGLVVPDTSSATLTPGDGRSVVGLSLPPGAEPGLPLQVGDRVRVALTEPAYACAAGTAVAAADAAASAGACAVDVQIPGLVVATVRDEASGQMQVSVEIAEDDAARIASGAALGRVAVVLDSREN